jgi:SEC-C motif-containing protein
MTSLNLCPCGSQKTYLSCCQPYHNGVAKAATVMAMMRSRYSAFVKQEYAYLLATHHRDHLHGLTLAQLQQGEQLHWLGLTLLSSEQNADNTQGNVTFKAWYLEGEAIDAIFENSEFIFEEGRWFYTQGEQFSTKLPERNTLCICHSGKKFKQCCMKLIRP